MKCARVGESGRELPVVVADDHRVDLSARTDGIDGLVRRRQVTR